MLKYWLLRLHRWTTLVFALPLAVLIVTGLILSFEPVLQVTSVKPGSMTVASIEALLARHDPEGKARSISLRAYENRLSLGGVRPDDDIDIDTRTGAELLDDGQVSNLFYYSRIIHEHLITDFGGLIVHLSTMAMLVLIALGMAMGWPHIRNTVSGWHKAVAWGLLPLLILSPLTGLLLAWGLTFSGPPAARSQPMPILEAVRLVGASHDLSGLVWLRNRGGRQIARIVVDGGFRTYAVAPNGLQPAGSNWPRLIHEGNFAGIWSGLMNVVISIAFIGLMATGLIIWARRTFRKRPERARNRVSVAVPG
jgi:uncharacterized iron-regulated membrane protein